ncbi:ATP-binding protein [Methylomicrobium sp. Wu6]|uniref:sensor histidine kinase n=1 Tax=Methylomicrobium sp. Wu6 TaxID=3107928 RepID=UPI002DD683C2|nr:ATP-binding protein [Methylomicrobium sp. Wu6]MEC4747049.1 ATP-binding protein [Methylomicrobium sp. Wu6]
MSWITVLWSMLASASLTFALLPLFIWAKGIQTWANLSFAVAAVAVAIITGLELMAMRTTSIEQMATILRWVHLPILVLWVAIVCFVRFYFDAGRSWLAWTGAGLRVLALILSLTTGQNLFFKEITGLKQVTVLGGETVSIAQGILNPWYVVGPLSTLALAAFVLDAAVALWRRETDIGRRRAIVFSGSIIFFLLTALVHSLLVNIGAINSPYIVGLSFMPILVAMSYELSYDMLHSVQIADQLQASEAELRISKQRMHLAASAADLRLWEWDIVRDEIWSTEITPTLYGTAESEKISFDNFLSGLYEEDRQRVRLAVEKSMTGSGNFESEYRIKMPDGRLHWFNSRGRIEFGDRSQPLRMLGVTMDITRRKQAELEVQLQRNELTHLSRVTLLGELSGSLAHELNQPLTAILSNAQAAQRFLARGKADLAEVRNILNDIIVEDRRAGDIIQRLRQMLKKGDVQLLPIDLNKIVQDVLKLVNSDLVNHNITVNADLDQKLNAVIGDRVQLQQVLLNLIMNACEAMSRTQENKRRIFIRTERTGDDKAQVSVVDQGPGILSENIESVFEPFFTTKSHGMGLGLTICRNMITAHRGQLWAINNNPSGTGFYFTLPIHHGESA